MNACVAPVITDYENKLTGGTQILFMYLISWKYPSHVNVVTHIHQQVHIIYIKSQIVNTHELSHQ